MYINTASKEKMEASILEALNIDVCELDDLFETCFNQFQKDHAIFILDDQYDFFMEYVKKHLNVCIDHVSFYHLSRRLNENIDFNGYSLVDVLCKGNLLSRFLKKYGLSFKYLDGYIHMYLNDKEIKLDNLDNYSSVFLRQMFESDDSFKGFAFRDAIEKNDYYEILKDGPELFGYLFSFVENDIIADFKANSKYYLLEYQVPIELVYFDGYEELNDLEKQYHMIVKSMQRLYAYRYDSVEYDEDNPILGMKDDLVLDSKYLVSKQEI